ncbi:MAG: tetratricopeptide repeat protein [Euryarchaeota archaeon]|nr:tetratricopeptide repeat protein [Euryarchaeota archaeon]
MRSRTLAAPKCRVSFLCSAFSLLALIIFSLPNAVAEGTTIVNPSSFNIELLFPLATSLFLALIMWKIIIPNSMSSLQVAFEIDDSLYEVHRLTKTRDDVKDLFNLPRVGFAVTMYLMAMTGVLLLIAELIFNPTVYFEPNLILMGFLLLFPILLSPWETFNAQIEQMYRNSDRVHVLVKIFRRTWTFLALITATGFTLWFGITTEGGIRPIWLVLALLVFMSPTIIAYGRILGASWNMLLLSKWRTMRGQQTPINPDPPSFGSRISGLVLCIFLITMPVTAINGIMTVAYVLLNNPDNAEEILNFGGIIGYSIYEWAQLNEDWIEKWVSVKQLASTLTIYLSMNVAIVGLAFIFELTRNLFIGGQTFGGIGGVTLSSPREIRSEDKAQAKLLYFSFAGFSGYTVLLLIMICYKEFSHLMPFTSVLVNQGFTDLIILESTWIFIAVGQGIFLLVWLLSIIRFISLSKLTFDLSPDERREGVIMSGGGDWMRTLIEQAARNDDIDRLRRFSRDFVEGDEALVRLEKSRAKMIELALRGLWPSAIDEARKLLAQQGGDDDEARMIIAAGHVASRRLDAAREALRGLEQPEGYDEPELLAFVTEWMDPWRGQVTEDDMWDWENNSCVDHIIDTMKRLRSWMPVPPDKTMHRDKLTVSARLSHVALLRSQRRSEEALDISLEIIKQEPLMVKARIAAALCLLDTGDWHSANSIHSELSESDPNDPRVNALGAILGIHSGDDEFETSIAVGKDKERRKWVNEAPVNAVAALCAKRGEDEALNANVFIAASEAVEHAITPIYKPSTLGIIFRWFVLVPLYGVLGIWISTFRPQAAAIVVPVVLTILQIFYLRIRRSQRRVIKHRDQKAMIAYAKRFKRRKVKMSINSIPIGNHMLLSGLLISINGAIYDLGLPGWLVVRLPKDSDKVTRQRLSKRARTMKKNKVPRLKPLKEGWWLNRPKSGDITSSYLEHVIGPSAYRGRSQYLARKDSHKHHGRKEKSKKRVPISEINMARKGIPHHSRLSEKPVSLGSKASGPKLPGSRTNKPSISSFGPPPTGMQSKPSSEESPKKKKQSSRRKKRK